MTSPNPTKEWSNGPGKSENPAIKVSPDDRANGKPYLEELELKP